jgi:tRNA pseudouridine38-40 synthase
MRIAIGIEYDGTPYLGWQSQPNGNTVQDHVQAALSHIAQHPVQVTATGRTDSGVHALMQVAHFDTHSQRPLDAWVRGCNSHLPDSIRIVWARAVAEQFHARHSALARHYQFLLFNRRVASAVRSHKVSWYHLPLDFAAMQQGIQYFIGQHDFSAFRASECQAPSPVKTMLKADLQRFGDYFLFSFSASGFLHHQVRNMVGALVYVGNGRLAPSAIADLLQQKDRRLAPPTFSGDGLYLTGVSYAEQWQLPASLTNIALLIA